MISVVNGTWFTGSEKIFSNNAINPGGESVQDVNTISCEAGGCLSAGKYKVLAAQLL